MAGRGKLPKFLLKILGVVLTVLLLLLAAAALILAKPQNSSDEDQKSQPLLTASPAVTAEKEEDLIALVESFPAPVMSFMSGSGMTFLSAVSSDFAYSGGFGRMAVLYWQTPEGQPMILESVYPAAALNMLENGYSFSRYTGPALFASQSVRMENDDRTRLHTVTDEGLYIVIIPRALDGQLSTLCRSLQLFTVSQDN